MTDRKYSLANQEERYARAKRENNRRYLDITTVYNPSKLKGMRVVVTGANKGNGLALSKELKSAGAHLIAVTRSMSDELKDLEPDQLIKDVDVTDDEACANLASKIEGGPVDMVSFVEAVITFSVSTSAMISNPHRCGISDIS